MVDLTTHLFMTCVHTESFDPPDAEDPPTPMELDDDDVQWHQWLNDLMNPTGKCD